MKLMEENCFHSSRDLSWEVRVSLAYSDVHMLAHHLERILFFISPELCTTDDYSS